jgi:hypothetical protein
VYDKDSTPDQPLERSPSRLLTVATLEIVVRDDAGAYLLLTCPHYRTSADGPQPLDAPHLASDGQWAPPHLTSKPLTNREPPRNVKSLRSIFKSEDRKKEVRWRTEIEQFADALGISNAEVRPQPAFFELKYSHRQPDQVHCYRILRFVLARNDDTEAKNFADPESLKGFKYLPIDDGELDRFAPWRYCAEHRRRERCFLSKPIATNVTHILEERSERNKLIEHAIDITSDAYCATIDDGLIACADLGGYGRITSYVAEHMPSLGRSGSDEARALRDSATTAFTEMFLEAGVSKVHIAGDGFICALPSLQEGGHPEAANRFLAAYGRLLHAIEAINLGVARHWTSNHSGQDAEEPPRLGSRLALHHGPFRYGKIAMSRSLISSFDGETIVEVARMEAGLRELVKGPVVSRLSQGNDDGALRDAPHTIVVSPEAAKVLGDLAELRTFNGDASMRLKSHGQQQLRVKEYARDAFAVYEVATATR